MGRSLPLADGGNPRDSGEVRRTSDAWSLGLALAGVIGAWVIIEVTIPPGAQNFPLWDDWAFVKGARAFYRGEGIHYYRWSAVPEIGQWLWAWPIVGIVGPSFWAFRLSTLALSLLGLAGFYVLLRLARVPAGPAGLAVACLGLDPLWFWLTGTFLTDVPALAYSLLALGLYAAARTRPGPRVLAGAMVAAVLGVLTRQNALAAPLTAALGWRRPVGRKALWALATLVPIGVGTALAWWISRRPDTTPLAPQWPSRIWQQVFPVLGCQLLGLAALPLLAASGPVSWKRFAVTLAVLGGAAFYLYRRYGGLFPYLGQTLPDGFNVPGAQGPLLIGRTTQSVLTAVGCLAGALWVDRCVATVRPRAWGSGAAVAGLLAVYSLLQAALLLAAPRGFDRYFVVLLPGAIAVAAAPCPGVRLRPRVAIAAVAVMGALAIATTHDWFAWNSACWKLGRRAVARGIAAQDIEGGTEWDAWHSLSLPRHRAGPDGDAGPEPPGFVLPWHQQIFPQLTGRYVLAIAPIPGTTCVDQEPYRLWLQPGEHRYLLLRAGEAGPTSETQ